MSFIGLEMKSGQKCLKPSISCYKFLHKFFFIFCLIGVFGMYSLPLLAEEEAPIVRIREETRHSGGKYALELPGDEGYIQAPQEQFADGDEVTMLAWVKINESRSMKTILFTGAGWNRKGIYFLVNGDRVRFQMGDGNSEAYVREGRVPVGEWSLVGGMWKDGHIYHIVNEEIIEVASWDAGYHSNPDFDMHIGQRIDRSGHMENYMNGQLDDIRIYDRALSEEEIQKLYAERYRNDVAPDNLMGWWPLNEGEGDTVKDQARSNDGSFEGEINWVLAAPFKQDLPAAKTLKPGQTVTLGPLELREQEGEVTYQWYHEGRPIEDATENSITLKDIGEDDTGDYILQANDERDLPARSSQFNLNFRPAVGNLPVVEELPDPLTTFHGASVETREEWHEKRRPELISLVEHYMFGEAPPPPDNFSYTIEDVDEESLDGKATRKIITLEFGPEGTPPVSLLLVVPNRREGPAPVLLGLNMAGNHTAMHDPDIPIPDTLRDTRPRGARAPGGDNPSIFIENAVDRGYAVGTMYCNEISPDSSSRAFTDGVHRGYMEEGQTWPDDTAWHTLAAWAWGLSRGADYLVQDDDIDNDRMAVHGHFRRGKAALWAGALDERFEVVIPHQSGQGGAAPARNRSPGSESLSQVDGFSHWFNALYGEFGSQVERLPFDAHSIIALCAPRAVLLTNATRDNWAGPKRQFDALAAAAPVYELLGIDTPLAADEFPEENELVDSVLGYWIRPGGHSINESDWEAWMDFCDKQFGRGGD